MRRPFILAALAGIVGLLACCPGASARDDDRGEYYGAYRERWYKRYERRREAIERYRERAESRAYERHLAHQRYSAERRLRDDRYWDRDDRWRPRYGRYSYGPNAYSYSYNPYYYNLYNYRSLDRNRDFYEPRDRHWYPDDYLPGGETWWDRVDREGRGGRN